MAFLTQPTKYMTIRIQRIGKFLDPFMKEASLMLYLHRFQLFSNENQSSVNAPGASSFQDVEVEHWGEQMSPDLTLFDSGWAETP
jgi:hypothetical protein